MRIQFGARLRQLRKARQVSQRDLALCLMMGAPYLCRIEHDTLGHLPARETIERIAAALELSAAESDELHVLAGKMPGDVEQAFFQRPELIALARRMCSNTRRRDG